MEGIIIYKSQYGSTRQYAEWLSSDLSLPILNLDQLTFTEVESKDYIIIFSYIKVGKIKAAGWIRDHWDRFGGKRIILVSVCGSYADADEQEKVLKENFPHEMRKKIDYFALPGRLKKDALNFWDKFIVFMGSKFFPNEEAASRMEKGFDWVDKTNLEPIQNLIEGFHVGMYE